MARRGAIMTAGPDMPNLPDRSYHKVIAPIAPGAQPDDFISRTLHEIRVGFGRNDVSLAATARRMGLSETGLYRALRRRNVEFSDLLRGLRRERACAWLRESAIPLTEIAFRLGYSELSAFSRAFRSWTGISPLDFRRRARPDAR